ncbi:hypothetical protein MBLNU230_g4295t1 [Neophaeotheca triangularis]
MTESSQSPLSGLWKPTHLQALHYGPDSVQKHLLANLPTPTSKAFIITGNSLATKTPLIKQVEELLGPTRHAGTFANIGQHAPVSQLDEATDLVLKDSSIDTLISIGGGSPIDSAKAISYRYNEKSASNSNNFLHHITIPTTLSAAECTPNAGYTSSSGLKTGVAHPSLVPNAILYDPAYAAHTPVWLFTSTGLRALDHALELLYHPTATEIPCKQLALCAATDLFTHLPAYKSDPHNQDTVTRLQLASFASLGFLGLNTKGSLGLSHTLGYALGSPYGIPHGITSCLTLGHVLKLKSRSDPVAADQISRLTPFIGRVRSGDDVEDGCAVGEAVLDLVRRLGLETSLSEKGVGRDQVAVITKTATRQESGPVFEAVRGLVEGLY